MITITIPWILAYIIEWAFAVIMVCRAIVMVVDLVPYIKAKRKK